MKPLFFIYRHAEYISKVLIFSLVALLGYLLYPNIHEITNKSKVEGNGIIVVIFFLFAMIIFIVNLTVSGLIFGINYLILKLRCHWVKSGSTILFNGKKAVWHIGNKEAIAKMFTYKEEDIETIVGVANCHKADILFVMMAPGRHHNIIELAYRYFANHESNYQQGFITSKGRFVDRLTGKVIARKANQLLPTASQGMNLFSECVWKS